MGKILSEEALNRFQIIPRKTYRSEVFTSVCSQAR